VGEGKGAKESGLFSVREARETANQIVKEEIEEGRME